MANSPAIRDAYRWHRQHGRMASVAILYARKDAEAGKARYPHGPGHKFGGNWQAEEDAPARVPSDRAYYCDNWPEGWRLLGSAEEVCRKEDSRRVDHRGWFTDEFQSATLQGYVLQLPARGGKPLYIPGTAHSDWDGVTLYPLDQHENPLDAASAADRLAEIAAEKERHYQAAWQAGQDAAEAQKEARDAASAAKVLRAELRSVIRAARRAGIKPGEAICAAIRDKLADLAADVRRGLAKVERLRGEYETDRGDAAGAFRDGFGGV